MPNCSSPCSRQNFLSCAGYQFALALVILFLLNACVTSKHDHSKDDTPSKPKNAPRTIHIVVKDAQSGELIEGASVKLYKNDELIKSETTNCIGYAQFVNTKEMRKNFDGYKLIWFGPPGLRGTNPVINSIELNPYLHIYDLFLGKKAEKVIKPELFADMHYHTSMRIHNLFGHNIYDDSKKPIPENLSWYKDFKKLQVLYKGKWKNIRLDTVDCISPGVPQKRKLAMMKILFEHDLVRCKGGSIKLSNYTQATYPHIREGKVFLAVNALSPFEHNVTNTFARRLINTSLVTGAKMKWLAKLGRVKDHMSHWENFRFEYDMIQKQTTDLNQGLIRFYDDTTNLLDSIPTIVLAVEGSHALQGIFFPHSLDYDMGARNEKNTNKLLRDIKLIKYDLKSLVRPLFKESDPVLQNNSGNALKTFMIKVELIHGFGLDSSTNIKKHLNEIIKSIPKQKKDFYIDSFLLNGTNGLIENIQALKDLVGAPICMMTIAHLSYNGLMGHAPSLDQGKFPNSLLASKNYSIRVSDEWAYRKQWEKTFFSIPGVNKLGKIVIDSLISTKNGHRIYIDLKHSDPFTREYFFDSVMIQNDCELVIPPICSHCAVTGYETPYYSPFVDEYSLTRAPTTKTFYPFGINLYNGEITKICQNRGIIGVPLEHRILGGYLNKRLMRQTYITDEGKRVYKPTLRQYKGQLIRRWGYMKRWLTHYLITRNPCIDGAISYVRDTMHVKEIGMGRYRSQLWDCSQPTPIHPSDGDNWVCCAPVRKGQKVEDFEHVVAQCYRIRMRNILKVLWKDYQSAEPFLQNVFHIIDHSGYKDPRDAWKHVCIGSDMDGLIDPIDICPTSSQYPVFKEKLFHLIPLFLQMRSDMDPAANHKTYDHYFKNDTELNTALDQLFYKSLHDFVETFFLK